MDDPLRLAQREREKSHKQEEDLKGEALESHLLSPCVMLSQRLEMYTRFLLDCSPREQDEESQK